jgi:hypothetical protein
MQAVYRQQLMDGYRVMGKMGRRMAPHYPESRIPNPES